MLTVPDGYPNREAIQNVLDEAYAAVRAVPRGTFGSLAAPLDTVVAHYADKLYGFQNDGAINRNPFGSEADISRWLESSVEWSQRGRPVDEADEMLQRAIAEVMVWWIHAGNQSLAHEGTRRRGIYIPEVILWIERFEYLLENPDALPYFENGLFDIAAVENAIAHDIDAALATSLSV